MLGLLCSLGLASCVAVPVNGGYQTTYTPNGYLLTRNQGIEFWATTPPGPFVAQHITVIRGTTTDVIYPPGTPFFAPNLASKNSD